MERGAYTARDWFRAVSLSTIAAGTLALAALHGPKEEPVIVTANPVIEKSFDPSFDYRTRSVEPTYEAAFQLVASLQNMRHDIASFARVADEENVSENLLATIATIESIGGKKMVPDAYASEVARIGVQPGTPYGYFHAKASSLDEVVDAAAAARGRLEEAGIEQPQGWYTDAEIRSMIPDAYGAFILLYGSEERAIRALQLAAQTPRDPIEDHDDPEQAARGAITYLAQIDANLEMIGVEKPSLAQLLAGYTGGHNGVREAALSNDDDAIGRAVANDWGASYTSMGEQVHAILDRYGSMKHALTALEELETFWADHPDIDEEIVGELYIARASDTNAIKEFDSYIDVRRPDDALTWTAMSTIWNDYTRRTTLASR